MRFLFFFVLRRLFLFFFGRSCKRKWEGKSGRESEGKTQILVVCVRLPFASLLLSFLMPSVVFFVVEIDKRIVTFFFVKKRSNSSSLIWFLSLNLSYCIILDNFLLYILVISRCHFLFMLIFINHQQMSHSFSDQGLRWFFV
jgi:hypothetical protein